MISRSFTTKTAKDAGMNEKAMMTNNTAVKEMAAEMSCFCLFVNGNGSERTVMDDAAVPVVHRNSASLTRLMNTGVACGAVEFCRIQYEAIACV